MTLLHIPERNVIIDEEHRNYIFVFKPGERFEKLKAALPDMYTEPFGNNHLTILPICEDTARLLSNLDVPIDGVEPFRLVYSPPMIEGQYPAMPHQITSAAYLARYYRGYNTSTPRTGKTGAMVLLADYLQQQHLSTGATLIIATVTNMWSVWGTTLETTLPGRSFVLVHSDYGKDLRTNLLKKPAAYYVINYDGVKLCEKQLQRMVREKKITTIIIDEMTHYGNSGSMRWKAMNAVISGGGSPVKYCYGISGSPASNYTAPFHMGKLINPSQLPCQSATAWDDLVYYRWGSKVYQKTKRKEAESIITKALQPTVRFDKADILELPPITFSVRKSEMTPEQKKVYASMELHMVAQMESGEVIETAQKSAMIQKLLQISQGTVITGREESTELSNKPRIDLMEEIIREGTAKAVIFCAYTGVIDRTVEQLRKRGFTVEKIDGTVKGKKRDLALTSFQMMKDPHILVCHPQTTAFGAELSAADTMIFNGPPMSGGFVYEQALERMSSAKQKAKNLFIVHLYASEAERKLFSDLKNGVESSQSINNLFSQIFQENKK